MSTKNREIQYGDKDLIAEDAFEAKNIKEPITIFLDQDVVDEFRARAKAGRGKYQTLINSALREYIFGDFDFKSNKDQFIEFLKTTPEVREIISEMVNESTAIRKLSKTR